MRFNPVRNPFRPSRTAGPELFHGRNAQLNSVAQALNDTAHGDLGHHLILIGERGIGKSSLLEICEDMARDALPGERTGFNFLVVRVPLDQLTDPFEITQRIADRLGQALDKAGVGNPGTRAVVEFLLNWEILGVSYQRPQNPVSADQALQQLVDKCVEIERLGAFQGILITMDEADAPPAGAGLGAWLKAFTERFASAKGENLLFLLAGQAAIFSALVASHRSAPRLFDGIELSALSMDERLGILDRGVAIANASSPKTVRITDGAKMRIAEISEGYPYFLQEYARAAFDAQTDGLIDENAVEGVVAVATRTIGTKFFSGVYTQAATTENYRRVLHTFAQFGNDWVARKDLTAVAEGVSRDNVSNALRKLKTTDALEEDHTRKGFYRLPTRAFAAWLRIIEEEATRLMDEGASDALGKSE